jgi:hypothetical protein
MPSVLAQQSTAHPFKISSRASSDPVFHSNSESAFATPLILYSVFSTFDLADLFARLCAELVYR